MSLEVRQQPPTAFCRKIHQQPDDHEGKGCEENPSRKGIHPCRQAIAHDRLLRHALIGNKAQSNAGAAFACVGVGLGLDVGVGVWVCGCAYVCVCLCLCVCVTKVVFTNVGVPFIPSTLAHISL